MRPGQVVDERFEIERWVGSGGMGQVFLAFDRHRGGPVAFKILRGCEAGAVDRFTREAMFLSELQHPCIVNYIAHGRCDEAPYLVMEWLEGEDLDQTLRRRRRAFHDASASAPTAVAGMARKDVVALLAHDSCATEISAHTPDSGFRSPGAEKTVELCSLQTSTHGLAVHEAVAIASRVARALGELHRRGLVHRDVKPANVFLVDGLPERAKLLDLGAARAEGAALRLTGTGVLVGTPIYMSPEQAQGESCVGAASDVWNLGCLLYECLAGVAPFESKHALTLLARIVQDEPPPLAVLRDDVPAGLVNIVAKMLRKDPRERYSDGAAVVEALHAFDTPGVDHSGRPVFVPGPALELAQPRNQLFLSGLTTNESRVLSVLVGKYTPDLGISRERVLELVGDAGAEIEWSEESSATFAVHCREHRAPKEQAQSLARIGLALRQECSQIGLRLATGRVRAAGPTLRGDLLCAALAEIREVSREEIVLDATTEALLGTRFVIKLGAHGACLVGEHEREQARKLLGKQTPWVGRQREFARLQATYNEAVEESVARGVLVTAAPGMGKSRMCHEFLQAISGCESAPVVIMARGDAMSARSPFALVGPAVRRVAQIQDGEPLASRREKLVQHLSRCVAPADATQLALFIGEMSGVPFRDEDDEALRAARKDPLLLNERVRSAFCTWLRSETARRPLALVVEDLHWGDMPSIQLIDAALDALSDAPLFLLALGRPEVYTQFPHLWRQRPVEEMRLNPLTKSAATELVRFASGDRLDVDTVAMVVSKAEGNAFYLEELIRCAVEGKLAHVPENVLGMVQARLHGLDQEARWVLRAASVFGEVFWGEGVQVVLGGRLSEHDVDAWLHSLEQLELIGPEPSSRLPNQTQYKFRHALVRDAAYELSTDEDRVVGHLLAGQWLLRAGEQDAVVLAEHFLRGNDRASGVAWLIAAATQAFESNDFDLVQTCVQRAVAAGAEGVQLGELRNLESQACYWKSDYNQAKASGGRALELLPSGSADWFKALGSTMVSAARAGDTAAVDAYFSRALATPCVAGAEASELVCLCRGTFQLVFRGQFEQADAALVRIERLAKTVGDLDALTRAQVNHVQGVRAAHVGDVASFLKHLELALRGFETAGDTRNVCLERTTLGWCYAELGQLEEARRQCEANLAYCRQLGAKQAVTYAKVNLGYILSLGEGHQSEARRMLEEAVEECLVVQNGRLEGWARAHLAFVEYLAKNNDAQLEHARIAVDKLISAPGLRAWAQACLARASLAVGDFGSALSLAGQACSTLEHIGGLLQGESLPPLILGEALAAMGRTDEAKRAFEAAARRLEKRAARLGNGTWAKSFLRLHDNRRTLEFVRRDIP